MNKTKNRSCLLMAAAFLAAGMLGGCSSSKQPEGGAPAKEGAETSAMTEEGAAVSYPLDSSVTLTYWGELNPTVAANFSGLGETPMGQKWQEKTGIQLDFQHPAVGQVSEQFNLLMSKETLPDLIEYSWISYPGGPEKAMEDDVIIPLNDVIDKYCPNLKAYLKANPEIDRMVKTDDGTYYCFPFIRGDEVLLYNTGLMIRQDWLDELGLERPETVDEWHTVLTAFKEKKGAAAPFTYQYSSVGLTDSNPFALAFEAPRGFYVHDDGTVHYGGMEEGHKKYLEEMNKWMQEGLLDIDLATLTGDQVSAKITNGSSGASFGWAGSNMGNWIGSGQATDPAYMLTPALYPVTEKGKKPEFGRRENNYPGVGSVVISSSCKDVEAAARMLDWGYSEEGHMFFNFGEDGVSYTMKDGAAAYTDEILANPDGLSISGALTKYTRANYSGPFVQDAGYVRQYYSLDSQREALDVWSDNNAGKHVVPPITPTTDESKELTQIMNEINTYRDEMCLKFILGTKSFDEWDNYVATIEGMKIGRALEIENAALERYKSR